MIFEAAFNAKSIQLSGISAPNGTKLNEDTGHDLKVWE